MKLRKRISAFLLAATVFLGLLPVYAAAGGTKLIALTFDDGPGYYTEALLDGLKARGAFVSFFVTGENAKNRPSLIKRAWSEGHQICSHSYAHELLTKLSTAEIKETLQKTDRAIDAAIGYDLSYSLRPPYGGYNDKVLATVGVPSYYWSVDTRDWESRNTAAAYRQFINAARDGSIVLMHDIHKETIPAALQAIDTLQKEGYEFVTLNELMVRRGKAPTAGEIYFSAGPGSYGTDGKLNKPEISFKDTQSGRKVFIKGDSRAKIYYTTDGTAPTPKNAKLYSSAFAVNDGVTVKALCVYDWNGFKSGSVSKKISFEKLSTPKISMSGMTMSFSGLPQGTEYYYSTDNSLPTKGSVKYTGAFTAVPDTHYTVKGYCGGYLEGGTSRVFCSAHGWLYTDCDSSAWFFEDCDRAVAKKIIKLKNRVLAPEEEISRSELVLMLYRAAGEPEPSGDCEFIDIPENAGYKNAVAWAQEAGIALGCGDGLFKPDEPVLRETLAAMLMRYMRHCGEELEMLDPAAVESFADACDLEYCFYDEVGKAVALGIIRGYGDGTFLPKANVTRAEAATMLMRVLDWL